MSNGKFMSTIQRMFGPPVDERHAFSKLFNFNGEPVKIVYTCRSRIDKAPCTIFQAGEGPKLKHVVQQHVPVDEFMTQDLMIHWYWRQLRESNREDIAQRTTCTFQLDALEEESRANQVWSRADLPDFVFDNLIIVGENSCANLMLMQLENVCHFYPRFSLLAPYGPDLVATPKVKIDLDYRSSHTYPLDEGEKYRLRTNFHRGSANAVAMIIYAPNPFNLQKNVLILFGCHRVGQYLLEEWLYGPTQNKVFSDLLRNPNRMGNWGQIVLSSPFKLPEPESYTFDNVRLTQNRQLNMPLFPFRLPSKRVTRDGFSLDTRAVDQGPLIDISLIIELNQHEQRTALTASLEDVTAEASQSSRYDRHSLTTLRDILTNRFDESELRTLSFELGVDYESLPVMGKAQKATELVRYVERRDSVDQLVAWLEQNRPDIPLESLQLAAVPQPTETRIVSQQHPPAIEQYFLENLPFLHGHYWESQTRGIGLHVTLYEFATYLSHDTLVQGSEHFSELQQALTASTESIASPTLMLVGCEVFPSSIVLHADLPSSFNDSVKEICRDLLPNASYFNVHRIPFPLHCTVVRFTRELSQDEKEQLLAFAEDHRQHTFGEYKIHTLSLLLARKQPYQNVERRFNLELPL